jgi:PPM family protein phosphatase
MTTTRPPPGQAGAPDGGVGPGACPGCGAPVLAGDRFCESCGRNLLEPAATPAWLSSTADAGSCRGCGSPDIGPEGYCERCGQRRHVGQDRVELDLGSFGAATDRGRHKRRNEDAVAIGRQGAATVAVVCDGVSSSTRADEAAHAAADTGIATILEALASGADPSVATQNGARTAAAAVAGLPGVKDLHSPPSCTYVSAVVTDTEVTVGWVGDSRAYWLAAAASACLTTDDSLAAQLAAASGETGGPPAGADPQALALVRWFGADAGDTEPHVVQFAPSGPGHVLVCSDGLHRYLADPAELATAAATVPGPPVATARGLTQLAVDAGGLDNIAVAVLPFPPRDQPAEGPTR